MFKLIVLVLAHRLPSNGIHHPSSPPLQHLTQWGSGELPGLSAENTGWVDLYNPVLPWQLYRLPVVCISDYNFLRAVPASSKGSCRAPHPVPHAHKQPHLARCARPLWVQQLTFGAPLRARSLTPAMAALPSTDIDPETKRDPWVQRCSLPKESSFQNVPEKPPSCFRIPLD